MSRFSSGRLRSPVVSASRLSGSELVLTGRQFPSSAVRDSALIRWEGETPATQFCTSMAQQEFRLPNVMLAAAAP